MMKEIKVYKITLEPLDWFFFGGESTFDNSVKQSYIAHSNLFPQQTTLLGMLRYQLLKQKGLLLGKESNPNWKQMEELIGADSFIIDKSNQSFGVIKGLSPVFVEKETIEKTKNGNVPAVSAFFPVPLTKGYKLSFDENVKVYLNGEQKECLICDNDTYDAKKYDNYLFYQDKSGNQLKVSEIFHSRMQIGITKNTDGGKREEGSEKGRFFKHEMIRFNNDREKRIAYRFAFFVELEEDFKNDFVFLGAERSCFKMEATELEGNVGLQQEFMNVNPSKAETGRIELLSPTYVSDITQLNKLCLFHWSFQMPFRNITQAKDGRGNLNSGEVTYKRNNVCYNMLCAGSVLFFDETNRKDIEDLLGIVHLQTIGYNYYDSMNININKNKNE